MGEIVSRGYDALENRIAKSHEKNVAVGGFRFQPTGSLDMVRNAVRFGWEMVRAGSADVESAGVGFLILGDDGRIVCDYLFVDA